MLSNNPPKRHSREGADFFIHDVYRSADVSEIRNMATLTRGASYRWAGSLALSAMPVAWRLFP
ncbi:hypothetical protein CFter6_5238 [Collimonas fungivorans]|uniref:Uncharacterized protein n=1 Tax=Collimonas fungivorans TaxID=158899 RepID=A0A127PJC7_9BURK|nr:hypothetical protein CFter6_5238 [Collimonas fungivorans]